MSGIRFENQSTWMTRNWVFNQFLGEVIRRHQDDPEMCEVLQIAIYHNGLHLHLVRERNGDMADKILKSLNQTATTILNNSGSELLNLEAQGRLMFLEAIRDFLMTNKSEHSAPTDARKMPSDTDSS
jgi:hypothetical protein